MVKFKTTISASRCARIKSAGLVSVGLICGFLGSYGWAAMAPPTEHKDLKVEQLGFVPGESMAAQVGLKGYKLLLRRITINPGGQIAKHSHATSPGVVYIDSGSWTEGRDSGETNHSDSGSWTEGRDSGETNHSAGDTFIEDINTVHWFYNRGDEPAAAYVCDIKPAG